MAEERGCALIDWKAEFNAIGFENFAKEVKMDKWGVSYTVVSIMGPQSSGKSTLLNHLFNTNFEEMDANIGRRQTTQGIWVAKSGNKPRTLVMDLEGSDSRERKNGPTFEKRSGLFAFAISDVVLINMWCTGIGLENAASRPLLKTIFQFMLCRPRQVTLIFVLRDKTETSLKVLRRQILEDMKEIWNSIDSPIVRQGTPLNEFFNVKVEALCHYILENDQFKKQVAGLKKKISGVGRDQGNVVHASSFPSKAKKIWEEIKDIKDLNIPSMEVLVAKIRCDEIAIEMFERFKRDYKAKMGPGKSFISLLDTCLSEYDEETRRYAKVSSKKRKELREKLLLLLLQEAESNRKGRKTNTVALCVTAALGAVSAVGIAVGLATPGLQGLAIGMCPVVAGLASELLSLHRGRARLSREDSDAIRKLLKID